MVDTIYVLRMHGSIYCISTKTSFVTEKAFDAHVTRGSPHRRLSLVDKDSGLLLVNQQG